MDTLVLALAACVLSTLLSSSACSAYMLLRDSRYERELKKALIGLRSKDAIAWIEGVGSGTLPNWRGWFRREVRLGGRRVVVVREGSGQRATVPAGETYLVVDGADVVRGVDIAGDSVRHAGVVMTHVPSFVARS